MLGMLAFVVDVGLFLMTRQELQKAADAAALAGVMEWQNDNPDNDTPARDEAMHYARLNRGVANALCVSVNPPTFDAATPNVFRFVTLPGGGTAPSLHVRVTCQATLMFGRLLWRDGQPPTFNVAADAQAAQGCLDTAGNVVAYTSPCTYPRPSPPDYGARLV